MCIRDRYWYRSHVTLVQFAPAALVLSAGLTITVVRRRGEWTALRALGASWVTLVRPIAVVCVGAAVGLLVFQELVVSTSGPMIDRIMVEKFGRWGDFMTVYSPRRWFRAGDSLLNVRGEANPERLEDVRVFELGARSELRRWIEAKRLVYVRAGTWRVEEGDELLVSGAEAQPGRTGDFQLQLPIRPEVTQLAVGRPEWLPMRVLSAQVPLMATLELPTETTRFAVQQRWAQAVSAVLAAVLAALLGLRASVRPSVPRALIEGAGLYGALFLVGMISRSLAINGRLPIAAAAWALPGLLAVLLLPLPSRAGRG